MHNRIQPFSRPVFPQQVAPTKPTEVSRPTESPPTAASSREKIHPELSEAEDRMIRRYFPESPGMKLKLYGPGRNSRSIQPQALGQRIDLRG